MKKNFTLMLAFLAFSFINAQTEFISAVTAPTEVSQNETVSVNVSYTASDTRDIVIWFQLNEDPWTNHGGPRTSINAGTATIDIDVVIGAWSEVPVGSNYKYVVLLVPTGEGYPSRLHEFQVTGVNVSAGSLSVEDLNINGINMFPNPVSDISVIRSDTPLNNIALYSLTGKTIFNKNINSNEYQLDVSSYSKGMYLLSVTNTKGTSTSKLIVD